LLDKSTQNGSWYRSQKANAYRHEPFLFLEPTSKKNQGMGSHGLKV
jgi:hypothetical protein